MKRLKKLLIIFILIISFMYIGSVNVEAKTLADFLGGGKAKTGSNITNFDWNKMNLECIYSDGRKYSYQGSFSDLDQTKPFSNNSLVAKGPGELLRAYDVASVSSKVDDLPKYDSLYYEDIALGNTIPEKNRIKGEIIYSKPSYIARIQEGALYCAPKVKTVKLDGSLSKNEKNEGSDNTYTYLTFDHRFNYLKCMEVAGYFSLNLFKLFNLDYACTNNIKTSNLLSVEYTMKETSETKTYFIERKVPESKKNEVQYGTDAVRSKEQIYVYVYKNVIIVEKDGKFKPLIEGADIFRNGTIDKEVKEGKKPTIYLNDPFFKKVGDYLEPSADPHFKARNDYAIGYKEYVISDIGEKDMQPGYEEKSICEYIPNTAKLIRKAIKAIQIMMPIILIFTIIIDVLNIVKTDNPDKDIPALTKKIRMRLILAVIFLLLPILAGLIIRLLNKFTTIKNVATIKCLFE